MQPKSSQPTDSYTPLLYLSNIRQQNKMYRGCLGTLPAPFNDSGFPQTHLFPIAYPACGRACTSTWQDNSDICAITALHLWICSESYLTTIVSNVRSYGTKFVVTHILLLKAKLRRPLGNELFSPGVGSLPQIRCTVNHRFIHHLRASSLRSQVRPL